MVTFVSIFLGLLIGQYEVEVSVPRGAHEVAIVLDGLPVAAIEGPPWRAAVDFGARPAPRRLEAIAYDLLGQEIGRAEQWINLPRPAADLEIGVQRDPVSGRSVAVLTWESLAGAEPLAASVSFDGKMLESSDPRRWELPEHDPERLHFLRAELDFPGSVAATAERLYGGTYRETLGSVATAVIVSAAEARDARRLEELETRFVHEGVVLEPVAIERGPIDLVFVVSRGAAARLAELRRYAPAPAFTYRSSRLPVGSRELEAAGDEEWRMELLFPVPFLRQGAISAYSLFPHSQIFTPRDGRLARILTVATPPEGEAKQRLGDAVAVAGLTAAAHSRRRAAILLLGDLGEADDSEVTPEGARAFLADLQVPLEVWSLAGSGGGPWGESVNASTFSKLARAGRALLKSLGRQRVVWLEGALLPRQVRFAGGGFGRRAGWTIESSGEWTEVEPGTELLARPDRDAVVVHRIEAPTEIELLERREGWARARVAGWWGWLLTDPEAPDLEAEPLPNPYADRIDVARRERLTERLAGLSSRTLGPYPLWTDVDNVALIEHLSTVASSLETLYPGRYGLTPAPTGDSVFILFESPDDYHELARQELGAANVRSRGQSSFRLEGTECCTLLAAATWVGRAETSEVRQIVVHELGHLLARRAFDRRLPLWLEEGLAEDLAFSAVGPDGTLDPTRLGGGSEAVIGAGNRRTFRTTGGRASLRALVEGWHGRWRTPLPALFDLGWRDLTDPEAISLAYTESGLLVRQLLSEPATAEAFRAFLGEVAAGERADSGRLLERLGTNAQRLDGDLFGALRRMAAAHGVPLPP